MRYLFDGDFNISAILSPPKVGYTRNYISASLVLTALLTLIVPFLATVGKLPLIPVVALAGVVYAVFVAVNDMLFEGMSSALFVLVLFNADVPILNGPGPAQVDIYLMDLAVVLTLALFLWWEYTDSRTNIFCTETTATVGFLGFFVLWAFLSAVVANGPSQSAAFMFAITQVRYVAILLASVLVIRRTNIWCGIYPLAIGVGGNALVALAQVANDRPLGLSYLGEIGREYISRVVFGPIVLHSGMHIGGFAGSTRTLTGLLLLLFPIVVFWSLDRSRWRTVLAGSYVLVTAFIVRMGESDAGWAALLLTLLLSIGFLSYHSYRSFERRYLSGLSTFALGIGFSLVLYASRFVGPNTDGASNVADGTSGDAGTGELPTGPDTSPTARNGDRVQEWVTDLVTNVPFIQSSTFSVRLQQYVAAIEIGRTYPLFGIGGFNFYLLSKSVGLPQKFAVHNTFLAYLAATGVPGVIAYTVSVGIVLFVVLRRAFFGSGEDGLFWGLVAAGMIGFHALSFWITIHNSVVGYGTFWAVSGMVLGAERAVVSR